MRRIVIGKLSIEDVEQDQVGIEAARRVYSTAVESAATTRRRDLAAMIVKLFYDFNEVYGCRRIAAELNRRGVACSVGLVADLMREEGLRAVQPRAYKRTTKPGEDPVDHPDLIGGDFAPGTETAAPKIAIIAPAGNR